MWPKSDTLEAIADVQRGHERALGFVWAFGALSVGDREVEGDRRIDTSVHPAERLVQELRGR